MEHNVGDQALDMKLAGERCVDSGVGSECDISSRLERLGITTSCTTATYDTQFKVQLRESTAVQQSSVPSCLTFKQDVDGDTFLIVLASNPPQTQQAAHLIQQAKPDQLDLQNKYGQTAAHVAACVNARYLLRLLINGNANLSLTDMYGKTPVHIVAETGNTACIREIFSSTPDMMPERRQMLASCLKKHDHTGYTPLQLAVIGGHAETVEMLCMIGASCRAKVPTNGYEAIHLAVERSFLSIILILLEKGNANIDAQAFNGATPLHIAAGYNNQSAVGNLLALGADPGLRTFEGFMAENFSNNPEILKSLRACHGAPHDVAQVSPRTTVTTHKHTTEDDMHINKEMSA